MKYIILKGSGQDYIAKVQPDGTYMKIGILFDSAPDNGHIVGEANQWVEAHDRTRGILNDHS
jgi:hypothetical protein